MKQVRNYVVFMFFTYSLTILLSHSLFCQEVEPPQGVGRISIKDEQEVLDTIKLESPEQHRDLIELRKKYPRVYRRLIQNEFRRHRQMMNLRKTKPEVFEKIVKIGQLERKSYLLARQYKQAETAERKAELKTELKNLLRELFELKQERYQIEFAELEKQIKELKTKIGKRTENKEKIIESRLENLLTTEEELEW